MKRDLEELLRVTDAGTSASTRASDLGDRVRGVRSRKRRIRRGVAACVFAIGIASIAIAVMTTRPSTPTIAKVDRGEKALDVQSSFGHRTHPNPNPLPEGEGTRRDFLHETTLDALAQVHERTAELLLNNLRSSKDTARKASDINTAQQQRDRAALILIYDADRYLRDDRPADAIAAYRRTVDLFPQSQWAEVARERLKQHES